MKKYIIKRILFVIPIMLALSFLTFSLTYLSPADPAALYFESRNIHPQEGEIEAMREEMGLNDPLLVQYGNWLKKALHGDFGTSYFYSTPVWDEMMNRIPNTLLLTCATVIVTILLAVPLGIISAVYQNKWIDYLLRMISFFGVSMPSFWVGTMLMYFFGVKLHALPIMGSGDLQHLVLPTMTLSIWMTSVYIRRVRGSMLEEMSKDYLTGAVAKGIPRSHAIMKYVLPNSLLAVITMFGMSVGALMGGATIIETIFEWKGIGMMAVKAIRVQDFPIIQCYVLWMAFIYVFINLAVDLLYEVLDPRIRLMGK